MKSKVGFIHEKRKNKYRKKLGPIRTWLLRRKGKKDMLNGLIRAKPDDNNTSESTFFEKEDATFGQAVSLAWETAHENNRELFKDLEKAIKMQTQYEQELESIERKEPKPLDGVQLSQRKKGEESLSDDQIARRRQKEENSRNSGYRARKSAAAQKVKENIESIEEIRSEIVEEDTSCRLFCFDARHYFEQRRAAYREGVLLKIPEDEEVPKLPLLAKKEDDAERVYAAAHESTMQEALRRIERYRKLVSVENATDEANAKEV